MQAAGIEHQPTHLVNVNQVFFWSSDTHSHVVTCREKTQYSIRQTRTCSMFIRYTNITGPSNKPRPGQTTPRLSSARGSRIYNPCLRTSTDLTAQNQSVIAPTGVSSIITDLCVDLKYNLFTYLNCSNLFLMPHFFTHGSKML